MSRVAKNPVVLPSGVQAAIDGQAVTIKGKNGQLGLQVHKLVTVVQEDNEVRVAPRNTSKAADALAGTTRALVANMVTGVSSAFERRLQLIGVGYRAQSQGNTLSLTLGLSHPVNFPVPEGISVETPTQTEVVVRGIDKQLVGQVAANIRRYRPPEPYKGKGIRYSDEIVVRKEAKKKK
jgi:large subunit ribosomal protein L6